MALHAPHAIHDLPPLPLPKIGIGIGIAERAIHEGRDYGLFMLEIGAALIGSLRPDTPEQTHARAVIDQAARDYDEAVVAFRLRAG